MFRDTFAVELLLAGVPLDQVSLLLRRSSIKVMERHYSPFVKARQEQLEASAQRGLGNHGLAKRLNPADDSCTTELGGSSAGNSVKPAVAKLI